MDKERLEELRQFVISEISRPVGADDTELTAEGKDLLALIDAEIVRQSATDEAVKDAITWAEQEHGYCMRYMLFGDADSATLAIDALRQYQKPTDEAVQNMVQTFESFLSSRHDANWVGDTVSNQYLCDSAQVALRQMGSTEPCEWCVDKHSYSLRYGLGGDTHKHCANCGRPLKGGE